MPYDVVVIGLGGMGSAAAAHLATRGLRVLALEQFAVGHDLGSSHGLTRIIRLAYFEHPAYVPLLRRAFELWRGLETAAGERLLHVTGSLDIGFAGGRVFDGSRRSCVEHGLAHEVLEARDLRRRVPAWHVPDEMLAVLQPDGGFLEPERCIAAHVRRAVGAGAEVRERERVLDWTAQGGTVRVKTDRGEYEAGQLVLAAGPWMPAMSAAVRAQLAVERQVVGWFEVGDSARFAPAAFPVFVFEAPLPGHPIFYGFPEHGVPGMKIGKYHHRHEMVDADRVARTSDGTDEAVLRDAVAAYLPSANGRLLRATVCLFTNTPDEHFVIDRDPASPEVLIVSPCSGHGFKFCAVVGEIVADLVQNGSTRHDIGLFRLAGRFGPM